MTLHVLPHIATNTTKAFVQLLITKGLLKPGFLQILGGKYLDEVDDYLIQHRLLTEDQLAKLYSEFYGVPIVSLLNRPLRPDAAKLLPESVARTFTALVYDLKGLDMYIAIGEPSKLQRNAPDILVKLRQQKGLKIHLAIAPRQEILAAVNKIYHLPVSAPKPPTPSAASPAQPPEVPVAEPKKEPVVQTPPSPQPDQPATPAKPSAPPEAAGALVKTVEDRVKSVDLRSMKIDQETLTKIPPNVAEKYQIIVFSRGGR